MGTLSADVDLVGDRLRQAVERFHGRELKEIAPLDRIAGAGAALGCLVCPTASALAVTAFALGWRCDGTSNDPRGKSRSMAAPATLATQRAGAVAARPRPRADVRPAPTE
ncbi:hypothetical protein SynMEDNS5_01791 [Synechococcus sp. MEDNS5]|uniref:hypothetical protein n=1 Tax=Synechococcus sp. MEDNS5 TaxID=1442554 RepID=UPI001648AE17|nr:hypothetical protein [Synechococcus sp. MEDNS5]QNJ06506.1 hypothetical protein SynMEDNS5_01791 [Synechococcus sp. MEDNS5]